MRAGVSLGLRIAAAVAFCATAAVAVIAGRGAPLDAALASAKGPEAQHASAAATASAGARPVTAGRCALSGLRISVGAGARVTSAVTRYPLDFTNVSGAPCALAGYPEVAAYRGDGVQVGAVAGHDRAAARRIVLAPGQTAYTTLDAAVPAARCGPVRAAGLRVAAPGQAAVRYLRRPLTACTARAPGGQDYLRVSALEAGADRARVTAARPD
jgi:hypothetical protein